MADVLPGNAFGDRRISKILLFASRRPLIDGFNDVSEIRVMVENRSLSISGHHRLRYIP